MELLHILVTALNAIAPIVLLMAFGYCLRQVNFLTEEFLKVGMKLIFNYLLPASLFMTVYDMESTAGIAWDLVLFMMIFTVASYFVGQWLVPLITPVRERKGSLLQSVVRSNCAIIGLPLAQDLGGGAEAMAMTAVLIAFFVPLSNTLAVFALSVFMGEDGQKADPKKIGKNIITNPLIISIVLGFLFLGIRGLQEALFGRVVFSMKRDFFLLYQTIAKAGAIASPLALIILGGDFRFAAVKGLRKEIIAGTVNRVVLLPLFAIGGVWALSTFTPIMHCTSAHYPAMIAIFSAPVAVSSAIMAGQMGNDEQLATQLVVWTSIASIVTIFLTVCILMGAGLLAM